MNIPKAIKVLGCLAQSETAGLDDEERQAVGVGIEALEFLERWRAKAEIQVYPLLPSETTD